MARDLNRWTGIGRLGKDPEVKFFSSGDPYCNISIACGETWKDKATGEQKEKTEWVNLAINGKLAEIVGQYAKKGSRIYAEGKLTTRKWQDQSGQDRYSTEIRIDGINGAIQLLDGKPEGGQDQPTQARQASPAQQQRPAAAPAQQPASGFADDEDLPF